MTKAVNCRPLTAEAEVQSQAMHVGFMVEKFSVVSYISEYTRYIHVIIISPNPHTL
jgi:hypothetical protein